MLERRQDPDSLLKPADREPHGAALHGLDDAAGTAVGQVTSIIHKLRWHEASLCTALRVLPTWQRRNAHLALVREFGLFQGNRVYRDAFGAPPPWLAPTHLTPVPTAAVDPALAVALAQHGQPRPLPWLDSMLDLFGESLDGIQVFQGLAAQAACQIIDAVAFAVQNVIVFAEENPSEARVTHEVAHVIQQRGHTRFGRFDPTHVPLIRSDQAEHQAEAVVRGAAPSLLTFAQPGIYRDTGAKDASGGEAESAPERRLREFQEKDPTVAMVTFESVALAPFGLPTAEGTFDRYQCSSPKPFRQADVAMVCGVSAATINKDFAALFQDGAKLAEKSRLVEVVTAKGTVMGYAFVGTTFAGKAAYQRQVRNVKAESATEDALMAFLASAEGKLETFDEAKAPFGVLQSGKDSDGKPLFTPIFLESSREPRKRSHFMDATGLTDNEASACIQEIFNKKQPDGRTLAEKYRLAKVGKEDDYSFVVIGKTIDGQSPYHAVVQERFARKDTNYNEVIQDYKQIVEELRALAKEKSKKLKPFDFGQAGVKETSDKALAGSATEADAKVYRELLVQWVLQEYPTIDELYEHIIASPVFKHKGRSGIKGNIFEQWIATTHPDVFDSNRPTFAMREKDGDKETYIKHADLNRIRRADGQIIVEEDTKQRRFIAECKAYSGGPGTEEIKQMQDYAKIIKKKIKGWVAEGDTLTPYVFEHVDYFLPNWQVAKQWVDDLNRELPHLHTIKVPDPNAKGQLITYVQANPLIPIHLKAGQLSQHIDKPPFQHPGLKLKAADVVLARPGAPELVSGSLLMDINMGGAVQQQDIRKNISPVAAPADQPTAAKAQPYGQIENKFPGMKSALDKFLKRVETDAKLADEGVEATIRITDGPSGIPQFNLKGTEIKVTFGKKGLTATGKIGIEHTSGKIGGEVALSWDGKGWKVEGAATVKDLIDGLKPFTLKVKYTTKDEKVAISCDKVEFDKTYKAIHINGQAKNISYDQEKGTFSCPEAKLSADLGLLGTAEVKASIEDSQLKKMTLSYSTPKLAYPKKNPVLAGAMTGSLTYEDGKFAGGVTGTVDLKVPAFQTLAEGAKSLGLLAEVKVAADGAYSGTIQSTAPILLGKHFQIPAFKATLDEKGDLSADFNLAVVKVKYLENVEVGCRVDRSGFHVTSANIKVAFGTPNESRAWGSLGCTYAEGKGFTLGGDLSIKLKDGLIAKGWLRYKTATHKVETGLDFVEEIQLLKYGPKTHKLVDFTKQIELISFHKIIGLYLDAGFDLKFEYHFDVRIKPSVKLDNLSLETFEFDSATATVVLLGEMAARLIGTPKLGLGLFMASPKLLRGGGGVKVPVVAEAKLKPGGTFQVKYSPTGGVSGAAKVGLALTFGITGSVRPYAEFSVLDGAYEPKWEGDGPTFTLLPERELYTHTIDFGGDLKTVTNPQIPTTPRAARALAVDKRIEMDKATPKDTAVAASKDTAAKTDVSTDKAGKQDGFDMGGLVNTLLGGPGYRKVGDVLNAAGEVWDKIKNFAANIVSFFKNWFERIGTAAQDVLRGFAQHGVFGYLKQVLPKVMGQTLFDVVEPMLTALGNLEGKVMELLEKPLPGSPEAFFHWALDIIKSVLGLSWDGIKELVSAVGKMIDRGEAAAGKFVNYLVQQGKIGVKRHGYYFGYDFLAADQYKIHLGGVHRDFKETGNLTSAQNGVALALWELLGSMTEVKPTNMTVDQDSGKPYQDYWTD